MKEAALAKLFDLFVVQIYSDWQVCDGARALGRFHRRRRWDAYWGVLVPRPRWFSRHTSYLRSRSGFADMPNTRVL
jgi:hypothetical protein